MNWGITIEKYENISWPIKVLNVDHRRVFNWLIILISH